MNPHPGDDDGGPGTAYVLHLEPAYRHARHYVGWTAGDVDERVAIHLQGSGSPLIRAAVAAGVSVHVAATGEPLPRAAAETLAQHRSVLPDVPGAPRRSRALTARDHHGARASRAACRAVC